MEIAILSRVPRTNPESVWSFTCLSKLLLTASVWVLVCKNYLSCLCWVKIVSVEYEHTRFTSSQIASTSAAIDVRCSSSHLFFQVEFVSSRFENPLSRTSYFSTVFDSKHKICRLNLSWLTKQFFNIGITIFTRLITSIEMDFSHKYQLWKLFRRIRNQIAAHAQKSVKCPF